MPLTPAITDLDALKEKPEVAALLDWNRAAVESARWDRNELTAWIHRPHIRQACAVLRDHPTLRFDALSDLTCVDWYPSEPRFEVVYHLWSTPRKSRLRLKVKLAGDDPAVASVVAVWPSANFFEREVFDLFGVRFEDHPYLRRLLMPEDWLGHPLRKDYPVEGYR
ncbi:MAG TPA: NADH-quinone oxidoreductase subunit C [Terriglobales bacterium]|nr:NADH-quinone oxidoreductase subunit C [Terriglobales bacterium]